LEEGVEGHNSCLAAREQTSAAQIAKASPTYNMKYFYSFLALFFDFIFNFLGLNRPSTSARTVVQLTMPLLPLEQSIALTFGALQQEQKVDTWIDQFVQRASE